MHAQVKLGNMPITLFLLPTAAVVFSVIHEFSTLVDQCKEGVEAIFDMSSFEIAGETFQYNTPYSYKDMSNMLQWLQQQKMGG